jgi:hypothetical protein
MRSQAAAMRAVRAEPEAGAMPQRIKITGPRLLVQLVSPCAIGECGHGRELLPCDTVGVLTAHERGTRRRIAEP